MYLTELNVFKADDDSCHTIAEVLCQFVKLCFSNHHMTAGVVPSHTPTSSTSEAFTFEGFD